VKENAQTQPETSLASPHDEPGVPAGHIDESCMTLISLAEYIPQRGIDKTARAVAAALCSYVDAELSQHLKIQESGLFPALRARANAGDIPLVESVVAQLIAEHATIAKSWAQLRSNLSDIAFCRPVRLSADTVARFATLYQSHANAENELLVSLAARICDLGDGVAFGYRGCHDDRQQIASSVAARRCDGAGKPRGQRYQ
jgi:hemerythrin-like domain-containing protein